MTNKTIIIQLLNKGSVSMLNESEVRELAKWYYIQADIYKKSHSDDIKKHIRRSLSYSWNMLGNVDINPRLVSEKAFMRFKEIEGTTKDIREMNWDDQVRKVVNGGLGDIGRKIFHWEHAFTRYDFIQMLLDGDKELTEEEVVELVKKHQIVWILKEEDKLLNNSRSESGHRYDRTRPDGWEAVYEELGIKIYDK